MSIIVSTEGITLLFGSLVPEVTVTEITMDAERIQLTARVLALSALCPHCGTASTAVHSYYTRQPRDLPLSGQAVRLLLHLRRFRCRAATCPVVTFSERLPTLIIPAAQRTVRLNRVLRDLALAFGGQAGARQCARTAMAASGATLLRRAHTAALPELTTPRILGIDDFAFCKGQIYGTILTDGETHAVVDLLPNRTAKTTAAWLKSHPGIDVVTRDRAGEYARGVRVGAPKAVQVADRFHLIKNAGEVLEHVVLRHHDGLRSAAKAVDQERDALTLPTMSSPAAAPESRTAPGPSTRQQPHSRQRRFAQYQEVLALAAQGLGPTTIAARTGLTRQTVARWLQARTFPERAAATPRTMLVTPYEPYLRERWQAGEHNSRQLWREIQAQGFKGGCETVRRLTVHWHTERGRSGPPPKHQATKPTSRRAPPAPATRPLSPRQARWLFLKSEAELKPEQRLYLEHLGRNNPDVHTAQQLVVAFLQLVRKREPESLEPWIQSAQASGVAELMEFAKGLVRDRAAVEAALRYKWSNGITEGHVNRLKMIKRTAYGRASFALLRQRVLAQV